MSNAATTSGFTREITARESALLYLRGAPDRGDIEHLIKSGDVCEIMSSHVFRGNYYSPNMHRNYSTSAVLLDKLLENTPPALKKDLVEHGMQIARSMTSITGGSRVPGDNSGFHRTHVNNDIYAKLTILAKHGADLNKSILEVDSPRDAIRLKDIALQNGHVISAEAGAQIARYNSRNMAFSEYNPYDQSVDQREVALTKQIFEQGNFNGPIRFRSPLAAYTGKGGGIITPQERPAIALAYDPTYKMLDAELAKSPSKNVHELFLTAGYSFTPDAAIKHLQEKHRLDINAADGGGNTALSTIMMDLHRHKNEYVYSQYINVARMFVEAGADPTIKNKDGYSARDYLTSFRNDLVMLKPDTAHLYPNPFDKPNASVPAPAMTSAPAPKL